MDSYHHVRPNIKYPAVYLATGMNDSRVPPWHTTKFGARLQAVNISDKPILIGLHSKTGHGVNLNSNQKVVKYINLVSFALWQTEHPDYQLKE